MSRLFNAAVGEPPTRVTALAARRQAIKRRIVTCISATVALAVVGSIGLAVSANAIIPHRVTESHPKLTMPRFYFTEDGASVLDRHASPELVVRSVATGAITGRVHCPGPHPQTEGVAVASDQTFFVDCRIATNQNVGTGIRIYRFQVSASGKISRFALIPGGDLVDLRGGRMAVTPDGSWLAMDAGTVVKGGLSDVLVINTKTGASRVWRPGTSPHDGTFHPAELSFAQGDKELAVFGLVDCNGAGPRCKTDEEIRVFSPATKGGLLSSGRRQVLSSTQLGGPTQDLALSAYLSQDGKNIIVATYGNKSGPRIVELSAHGGRLIRTLYRSRPNVSPIGMVVDSSGRFILWLGAGPRTSIFGRIDQGKLHPLRFKSESLNVFGW
ncbi:MAG TPA: hypothetical protein VN767_20295 [Streptosporangiaceae bacterium]|nr:hypothetical protein [Streptosporangiaceae bacterium]